MFLPYIVVVGAFIVAVSGQNQVSVDDTSSRIVYSTPNNQLWTVHTNVAASFALYNASDTFTDIQGAKATFTFNGSALEYWGNQGPYHGPCRINIDGQDYGTVNSHATADGPPILLFQKSGLSTNSVHTLTVTVENSGYPNVCEVDRFVYTAVADSAYPNPVGNGDDYPSGGSTVPTTQSNSVPIGPIVGGVVGGVALILIALLVFFLVRRRNRRKRSINIDDLPPVAAVGKLKHNRNSLYKEPTLPRVDLGSEETKAGYGGAGGQNYGYSGGPVPPFPVRPLSQASSSTAPSSAVGPTFPPYAPVPSTPYSPYDSQFQQQQQQSYQQQNLPTHEQQQHRAFSSPPVTPGVSVATPFLPPPTTSHSFFPPASTATNPFVPATMAAATTMTDATASAWRSDVKHEYAPVSRPGSSSSAPVPSPAERKRLEVEEEAKKRVAATGDAGGSGVVTTPPPPQPTSSPSPQHAGPVTSLISPVQDVDLPAPPAYDPNWQQ